MLRALPRVLVLPRSVTVARPGKRGHSNAHASERAIAASLSTRLCSKGSIPWRTSSKGPGVQNPGACAVAAAKVSMIEVDEEAGKEIDGAVRVMANTGGSAREARRVMRAMPARRGEVRSTAAGGCGLDAKLEMRISYPGIEGRCARLPCAWASKKDWILQHPWRGARIGERMERRGLPRVIRTNHRPRRGRSVWRRHCLLLHLPPIPRLPPPPILTPLRRQ